MKRINGLTILFVVTVVMVILMLFTIEHPKQNSIDEGLLFPGLLDKLSQVNHIHVYSKQDDFTVHKQGDIWVVDQRWNYPADFNVVKRTLVDMANAKILQQKTRNPKQFAILGVEGAKDGGDSLEITLSDGGTRIAGLILGHERELGLVGGPRQFYVRRQGENQALLAEGYLNINPLMLNWIKSEVMNIARERIAQVNIIQPDGAMATIINLGKDKFGTPEDREQTVFKYKLLGYDIAGTLYQLHMEDVLPKSKFKRDPNKVVKAEFITYDGLKVTALTSFDPEKGFYFTTFEVETTQSRPAPEDIAKLNVLKTPEEVKKEAQTLNAQLADWVYRFSGFIGTNLMRAKSDIVTESNKVIPMPADVTGGFGS